MLQGSDDGGGGTASGLNEALKRNKSARFHGEFSQTRKKPGATATTTKWRRRRRRNYLQSMKRALQALRRLETSGEFVVRVGVLREEENATLLIKASLHRATNPY